MDVVIEGELTLLKGSWDLDGLYVPFGLEKDDYEDMSMFSLRELVDGSEKYKFNLENGKLFISIIREYITTDGGYYRRIPDDKIFTYEISRYGTEILIAIVSHLLSEDKDCIEGLSI